MTVDVVQLGVAGVTVAVLAYVLKLLIDGKLHTDAEIKSYDERIADRDERIADLIGQVKTLTGALEASSKQQSAVLELLEDERRGGNPKSYTRGQ